MKKQAFTLVELAIVLVILGLLAGGILVGQALIRAGELRSVTTDFDRYKTAVGSFRDKYQGLPGDIMNATAFWGIAGGATGNDTACFTATSTGAATCNGNGDGFIQCGYNSGCVIANGGNYEQFRAWQQMANAGLIEGQYTGISGSTSAAYYQIPGTNVPKSRISSAGFGFYLPTAAGDATWFPAGSTYNAVVFGGIASGTIVSAPVLSPADAWDIDTKLDDGKPATGILMVYRASKNPGCTTNDDPTIADYVYTATGLLCSFSVKLGF